MADIMERHNSIIRGAIHRHGAFEVKTNAKGEPYFILKATNGQEVGRSEYYSSKSAMENGIESVKKNAPDAKIEDLTN